ncbi:MULTISPECIES: hypothetical protein [Sphingomonas]|uniref:hypothetical protein n=1 Tax=Sphingomonas TaxID=13687 RepID=UPI00082A17C2|nr:hypothetical protein [Sphingomonas sp. CCH10-B3]
MVSSLRRSRLTLPVASTAAVTLGLATAIGFALIQDTMLDRLVMASGLPAVMAAAEPPLGFTARAVLITLGGGLMGMLAWFALSPLLGGKRFTLRFPGAGREEVNAPPVLRRGDAHPDAPPRAPLFANRDLGTPFLDVHARMVAGPLDEPASPMPDVERAVPDDLDLPLSAFDPAAFAAASREPAPLPRFAPGERIETFELTPIVRGRPDADPVVAPPRPAARDTEATITALLERLERGVSTRTDRASRVSADGAMNSLRRFASGN